MANSPIVTFGTSPINYVNTPSVPGSGSTAGAGLFDLLEKGLNAYSSYRTEELNRDLIRAQTDQYLLLHAQGFDSQTNAQTGQPAVQVELSRNDFLLLAVAGLLTVWLVIRLAR